MKRGAIIYTLIFVLLGTLFSACEKEHQVTNIDFRITWTDFSGRGVAIGKIVEAFNEEFQDSIHVNMISGNEDLTELTAYIETEDKGGVVALPYRYVKYFGDRGSIQMIQNEEIPDYEKIYPALWEFGQVNDVDYGIPWLNSSTCLLYNKDLLNQAEVDPASIVDLGSLNLALTKIQAKTDASGIGLVGANHNDISWMVNQFVYGFDGKLIDESGLKVTVNSPQAFRAIKYYVEGLGPFAQPGWQNDTGVEVMTKFLNQQIAFEIQGVWGLSDVEKNGSPFEVGVIPLSTIGLYPEMGPTFLSITQNSDEDTRDAAIEFLNFMVSFDAQEMIMNGEFSPEHESYYPFRLPVRSDIAASEAFQNFKEYLPFLDGLNVASIDVPTAKWQTIKDTLYAPGLHNVMTGELDIATFLQQVQEQGEPLLQNN